MIGSIIRVLRGGSWILEKVYSRAAYRYYLHFSAKESYIGFRLAIEEKE